MDLGQPLIEYGPVDIDRLRRELLQMPQEFWASDREARVRSAGQRPGDAVFFYHDKPPNVGGAPLQEARSGFISVRRFADRPLFAAIQELIDASVKPVFPQCDVMRVQLAELPPGQVIAPHRDTHILAVIHRMHVPLVTHPLVKFTIARQEFFLKEGHLYDLNNAVVHSVENKSDVMRVHLMVDMLPHTVARVRYFDSDAEMIAARAPFVGPGQAAGPQGVSAGGRAAGRGGASS